MPPRRPDPIEPEPLSPVELEACRQLLGSLALRLDQEIAAHADATAVVDLDQAAIGRVSRGDALQAQAMAKASRRGLERRRAQIGQALESVAQGIYGECRDCGDPIGFKRLQARPEAPFCIACQSSRE
jgi:DnaK suppressor protein